MFYNRDFTNESIYNMLLRLIKALLVRYRGFIFYFFYSFHNKSGFSSKFGRNIRFINTKSIELAKNVSFGDNCRLECFSPTEQNKNIKIKIGENTSFGDNLHIGSINGVDIGKNVLGASKILIIDHNHGNVKNLIQDSLIAPRDRILHSKGKIFIGDNVWIGEGVIILSGARIGNSSIIPAYSIVKGEVECNTIYGNK